MTYSHATIEKEFERKAFEDIMSHKYFVHGKCLNCGNEYAFCTNKKQSDRDSYCSDKCYKEWKKDKIKREKEKHHYEVFKDNKFYYILVDGGFFEKRDFKGKTWMKKSEQDRQRNEWIVKKVIGWKLPILSEKAEIPKEAVKIIDKISNFLYDEEHPFNKWSGLTKLQEGLNSSQP